MDEDTSRRASAEIVQKSQQVIEAFRSVCVDSGHTEAHRKPLVSRHDPSIRFTNSTISVMKPLLTDGGPSSRWFLVQPAIRLRNLQYYLETGQMSPFGCSFIQLGSLVPVGDALMAAQVLWRFLVDALTLPRGSVVFRVSSQDPDLRSLAAAVADTIEVDGYEQRRYRHQFGIPDVGGRNFNIALPYGDGLRDVGNLIIVERSGIPIAVEVALGVSNIIACRDRLAHMLDITPGAMIRWVPGFDSDIAADAAGSSAMLALDGLRPSARGRGGNFRDLLRIMADLQRSDGAGDLRLAMQSVLATEIAIREHVSSHESGVYDLTRAEALDLVLAGLASLR